MDNYRSAKPRNGAPEPSGAAQYLLKTWSMSRDTNDHDLCLVERWVLEACTSVRRQGPGEPIEYKGLLMGEPAIGSPLMMFLDGFRQLQTTAVKRIEPGPNDGIYVETENSRYLVRRLIYATGNEIGGRP